MSISEELQKKARAAEVRLDEAEHALQLARAEYHAIVRRMHLAGSSLREIAQLLHLSHQRVQQMVQEAGGSWWQRIWRTRNQKKDLICTFCKRPQTQLAKLIAGPKVYICDACVAAAEKSMGETRTHALQGTLSPAREGSKVRCSFCSKGRAPERQLLTGSAGNICSDCLDICRQIIMDSST